ncbi:hypothetical protein HOR48_gp24 [Pectobacterium phage PP81]|uniref:Uncharacterized protein n=1 Tax=Pectobacterium phage PP81 TaxID=1927014 RepID=A0A3B8GGP5_9CAUD|nr:hypothetical protein HOR48_gp24 [Pectobacterium phage PP81]AYM47383.1 hypothetical protein PP81_gp24 [Pectobacterium phage PP81]
MKKAVPYLLLTCVGLGLCASYLIQSLPLSVTSKVMTPMLSSFVFSSAALTVLVLALRDTCSTTQRPENLNRLATLRAKERLIHAREALLDGMRVTTTNRLKPWGNCPECLHEFYLTGHPRADHKH